MRGSETCQPSLNTLRPKIKFLCSLGPATNNQSHFGLQNKIIVIEGNTTSGHNISTTHQLTVGHIWGTRH